MSRYERLGNMQSKLGTFEVNDSMGISDLTRLIETAVSAGTQVYAAKAAADFAKDAGRYGPQPAPMPMMMPPPAAGGRGTVVIVGLLGVAALIGLIVIIKKKKS